MCEVISPVLTQKRLLLFFSRLALPHSDLRAHVTSQSPQLPCGNPNFSLPHTDLFHLEHFLPWDRFSFDPSPPFLKLQALQSENLSILSTAFSTTPSLLLGT